MGEATVSRKKYEELMREFKALNREKESAEELAKSLRGELDLINSEKVVAVR